MFQLFPFLKCCKTDLDDLIILDGRLEHDHAQPDRRNIERQRVRQACKRKAEDEPSERPSKLIIKEIEKVGVPSMFQLFPFLKWATWVMFFFSVCTSPGGLM
jgi:hypothetical protein